MCWLFNGSNMEGLYAMLLEVRAKKEDSETEIICKEVTRECYGVNTSGKRRWED